VHALTHGKGQWTGLKDDMAEARDIDAGIKEKIIPNESVDLALLRGCRLEKPYLFFNAAQYEASFGRVPPKGKRANTINMPNPGDEQEERLWFFCDDGIYPVWLKSHTKGVMYVEKLMEHTILCLEPDKHRYQRQAPRMVRHQLDRTHLDSLASKKVLTLQGEKRRVSTGDSDEDDDPPAGDGDDDQVDPPGPGGPGPSSCRARREAAAAASGWPSQQDEVEPPGTQDPKAPLQLTPPTPSPLRRLQSLSLPSAVSNSPRGGASTFGGTDTIASNMSDDENEELSGEEDDDLATAIRHRIGSMPHSLTLMSKKMGNQERRAGELMKKLNDNPTENATLLVQFKSFLGLHELAKKASIKRAKELSNEELVNILEKLAEAEVTFEPAYKTMVYTRMINAKLQHCVTTTDAKDVDVMLNDCLPWGDSTFNVSNPRLAALDGGHFKKLQLFEKSVMHRVFIPLVVEAANKSKLVESFCSSCMKLFEEIPEDLDMGEPALNLVMDMLTCWRAVSAICDEGADLVLAGDDQECRHQAVLTLLEMAAKFCSKNIKSLVGSALKSTPYWAAKIETYMKTRGGVKEFCPKMKDLAVEMDCGTPGSGAHGEVLIKSARLLVQAAEVLRAGALHSFLQTLVAKTFGHAQAAMTTTEPGKKPLETLRACSNVVAEVSMACPEEVLICDITFELAECMKSHDAEAKASSMDTAIAAIAKLESKPDLSDDTNAINAALGLCHGLQKSHGARLNAFAHAMNLLLGSLTKGQCDASSLRTVALTLGGHLIAETSARSVLVAFREVKAMHDHMHLIKTVGYNDPATWTWTALADLQKVISHFVSASAEFEAFRSAKTPADVELKNSFDHQKLLDFINSAKTSIAKGKCHFITAAETRLAQSTKALSVVAGGMGGGKSWDDGLPGNPDWDTFYKHVADTLMKNDELSDDIGVARKQCIEDRAIIWQFLICFRVRM
jgi:hypothetical protein